MARFREIEIAGAAYGRGAGIFSSPFERDVFVAYVLSVIAMGRGEDLGRNQERLTQIMDEGERQQAIQLAEAW